MNVHDLMPWRRGIERSRGLSLDREPADSFLTLHREMNRLFEDIFRGFEPGPAQGLWPRLEVEETQDAYRISAELPGMEEKDVEVAIEDGVLTLRGEKRAQTEDRRRAFSERVYGRFERRLALDGIVEDEAQASFRNGVLTVTAPKSPQRQERVKRIPVNQAAKVH